MMPEVKLSELRVAIVHHWFVHPWGGAEKVIKVFADMLPHADLFAMMVDPRVLPADWKGRKITTSFLQQVPGKYRWRKQLMPFYPLALEQLDLRDYDLVISSESAPAKGVLTGARTCHVCYCNSPMRYIWDMYQEYKQGLGSGFARLVYAISSHYMRLWDLATASRVDYFVANSRNVAARIQKHYRRPATVLHCPTNVSDSYLSPSLGDYYLVLGRLVDYKRVDLAIQACNKLGRKLKIVGNGDQTELRKLAGPTVEFLGEVPREVVRKAYAECRALLFPGEEDFGLVPVEAQSFGRPVIAYGRGGALETVNGFFPDEPFFPEASGIFFSAQTVDSLVQAMQVFESCESRFDPVAIRERTFQFAEEEFKIKFTEFLESAVQEFRACGAPVKTFDGGVAV